MTTVQKTILNQLGGYKFLAMTGANCFLNDNEYLTVTLPGNKSGANYLTIGINGKDLYHVEFLRFTMTTINYRTGKIRNGKKTVIAVFDDIFCNQLQELFTQTTGLYTRL